jgi:hypothetical protein
MSAKDLLVLIQGVDAYQDNANKLSNPAASMAPSVDVNKLPSVAARRAQNAAPSGGVYTVEMAEKVWPAAPAPPGHLRFPRTSDSLIRRGSSVGRGRTTPWRVWRRIERC